MSIKTITDAISAISVSTATKTPTVYDIDNMKIPKSLPARSVFALPMGSNEGRDIQFVTSSTMLATWDIADLLLYDGVKNNSTLHSVTPELTEYVSNYLTAFKSQQGLGLNGVTIENIEAVWDEFEYPAKSDHWYYGVSMTLTVKEIIQ